MTLVAGFPNKMESSLDLVQLQTRANLKVCLQYRARCKYELSIGIHIHKSMLDDTDKKTNLGVDIWRTRRGSGGSCCTRLPIQTFLGSVELVFFPLISKK
mgnify:CR=1 FL=1